MRESAAEKARRYLAEGRLIITAVHGTHIRSTCRGDGAIWHQTVYGHGWNCDCPARGRCTHLIALGLVTAPPGGHP